MSCHPPAFVGFFFSCLERPNPKIIILYFSPFQCNYCCFHFKSYISVTTRVILYTLMAKNRMPFDVRSRLIFVWINWHMHGTAQVSQFLFFCFLVIVIVNIMNNESITSFIAEKNGMGNQKSSFLDLVKFCTHNITHAPFKLKKCTCRL